MFIKGRVFGGDTGYVYTGSYQSDGDSIRARVQVRNFLPGIPNITGVVGNFELLIEGKTLGDVINATGSVTSTQVVGIALKLTKQSNLPE